MKDHSRVVVVRPPFAESFAFFVRKFDTIEQKNISELIKDKGCAIPIDIIKWLILGCRVCGITGSQGSGKTTLLMSLIGFIHPSYNLRIQELSFELNLRQVYPDRNILSFRETDYVSGQEGLDIQKKQMVQLIYWERLHRVQLLRGWCKCHRQVLCLHYLLIMQKLLTIL